MAGERIKLTVKERESRGSADSRRLRKQGFIPGVLYGKGKGSYAISVPERELRRVLTGAGGLHAILDVVLEGQATTHAGYAARGSSPASSMAAARSRMRSASRSASFAAS